MSLTEIKTRIAKAAKAHGRAPGDITLIAVSKVQPNERVEAVLNAGHRVFGDNRVQEAESKNVACHMFLRHIILVELLLDLTHKHFEEQKF